MILKASQRGGAVALGHHLLKTEENEHVEIHDIRGFACENVLGAMKEIQAISMGTRCTQPVFSISLNPPETESVRIEVFETALQRIEERMGLTGQPRIVVFHEKEGRRHCHVAYSRIDASTMTAINLSHFKNKLQAIGKELYIENGWKMPGGFLDSQNRDPRNFTLQEWQAAKRAGLNPKEIKGLIQQCWSASDSRKAFSTALERCGFFLARGDRRSHVVCDLQGNVFSVARMVGGHKSQIVAKLGNSDDLKSVHDTIQEVARVVGPRLTKHIAEAKQIAAIQMKPLLERRSDMKIQHERERHRLDAGLQQRNDAEVKERASRLRGGWKGVWDKLRGEQSKVKAQNQMEAFFCLQRDRAQRHELLQSQLQERQLLQQEIRLTREREARQILGLYKEAARYRAMEQGELSNVREAFSRNAGDSRQTNGLAPVKRERGLDLG